MGKDYKLQFEVREDVYLDWKRFIVNRGKRLHHNTTLYNMIAIEAGIKHLIKNPKLFEQMLKERMDDD